MLVFFRRETGRHFLDLLAEFFNLCLFFIQQAFLFLDLLHIHSDFLGRDTGRVKLPFLVGGAITIVDPLDEFKKGLEAQKGVTLLDVMPRMYGFVA